MLPILCGAPPSAVLPPCANPRESPFYHYFMTKGGGKEVTALLRNQGLEEEGKKEQFLSPHVAGGKIGGKISGAQKSAAAKAEQNGSATPEQVVILKSLSEAGKIGAKIGGAKKTAAAAAMKDDTATAEQMTIILQLRETGAKGGAAKGAAFAKSNAWTVVCQGEYDKSVRSAAKMSDEARATVSKLLADDGLDAAKQFGRGGKVMNWFDNRNNAIVCESCSMLCSSEAIYRKHLCMGKCAGGKKVLFDAGNMLEFTSAGMPGKKEMAEKHPALSKVLEELVLEAKKKKK
jgi:hypothetical protein